MYFHAILGNETLPQFSWIIDTDGTITVQTDSTKPSEVRLWQATNGTSRDFRYSTIGDGWSSTQLPDQGGGIYVGAVPEPYRGWTAYFVELKYDSDGLFDYVFSTDVQVRPKFLPFAADIDFDGEIEGDVNNDGLVTLQDSISALQVVSGNTVSNTTVTADYDGDRKIGLVECMYILRYLSQQ